jgi:glutamate-1-semialdehyde 2,1-aminomutase
VERLQFCASVTRATMYCQRSARVYTAKKQLLKFEGTYHGANEAGVTTLIPIQMYDFPEHEQTSVVHPAMNDYLLTTP